MEKIKNNVRSEIEKAQRLSEEEYREFLEWLGSEAECREMALNDDDSEELE